jgi:CzcA family heavy metal efflux pump
VVSIQKSPGTNTLLLTREIDAALDAAEASLPAGIKLNRFVFRQSDFIRRSTDNVVTVLRDAAIIVAIILVLFLLNVRTTLITLTALPLSLAAALLILHALGLGLNVMTLGGLAVAIGELVDDAIIDVENVFRRLKENAARPPEERLSAVRVIFDASNEVRSAVVFATVLIVLVFAPMMFLGGLEGRFFRPLGAAYVVSILASLVVALTATPALCKLLLRVRPDARGGHGDGGLVRALKRLYEPTLRFALRRKGLIFGAAGLATAAALLLGATFGASFLPSFNEGTFTVFLLAPPGTSLEESDRLARGVERGLLAIDGVRGVTRRTGRAERDEHAEPPSSSEIEVTIEPETDAAAVRRGIDAVLGGVPGVTTMVGQPIEHRLSHVLSGTPAAIAINVFGEDLAVLRRTAKELEAALRALPGARDVNANREAVTASVPVRYRAADLAAAGLSPAAAAEQVEAAWLGAKAAEIHDGMRRIDLVVRLHADERRSIEDLGDFLLSGAGGARVRLREVADVGLERMPAVIAHENARRKAVVSCNVAEGANLGDLIERVRAAAEPIAARAGCTITFGGQFEARQEAMRTLSIYGGAVLVLMLLLLQASSGSYRTALLVMLNLPLALIGGIVAVFVADAERPLANALALFGLGAEPYRAPVLSLSSLVGFITLFGIAVRNGILLVNHYAHLTAEGKPLATAIVQGSMERLVPILMTALSAALGLLPLALAAGEPGAELLSPLAVVVLGGLVSSKFLNLIVVPAGYALVHGRRRPESPAAAGIGVPS